jgi:hypothetical protein
MSKTSFQAVADMNTAFGNKRGNYANIDWQRLKSQCKNILDEYNELLEALGDESPIKVRDALCDIQVFAMGAQHFMGVDGDGDMQDVVDGVMTRFIKSQEDLEKTRAFHWLRGVTETYTEGQFPTMVLKSSCDQPDAPKGKFLKSVSYSDTKFRQVN